MAKKEKNFCSELKRSTKYCQPIFHWKIPDAGFINYFDIVCCYSGKFYAIEAKISKSETSIPLVNFFNKREHELVALKKVRECGGKALILINVFIPHKLNICISMDPYEYESIVEQIAPKKSIKLKEAMDTLHWFPVGPGGIWPLKEILKPIYGTK